MFLFIITIVWIIKELHTEKNIPIVSQQHGDLSRVFVDKYSSLQREKELEEYVKKMYERGEIQIVLNKIIKYMNNNGSLYRYYKSVPSPASLVKPKNSWENVADGTILDGVVTSWQLNAIAHMLLNTEGLIRVSSAEYMSRLGNCTTNQLREWINTPPWES